MQHNLVINSNKQMEMEWVIINITIILYSYRNNSWNFQTGAQRCNKMHQMLQ
jgi:hypothetical protein